METGPRYRFKVYYNEVDVHQLKDENSQLRGEKIKLEESLVQEKAKRLRVDKKAREALEKAEKKGAFYNKKFIQLAKKVITNGKKVEAQLRRSLMTILSTIKRELKTNRRRSAKLYSPFLGCTILLQLKLKSSTLRLINMKLSILLERESCHLQSLTQRPLIMVTLIT